MKRLDRFDWKAIESELDREGYALLPGLLSDAECSAFAKSSSSVLGLRAQLYEKLAPLANRWSQTMGTEIRYPARLDELLRICRAAGQRKPQSAVVRLREGQQQPLRQNAGGVCVFPLQATVLLTQPGKDFAGGEVIMTEQRPRMQTRPMVVPLRCGDATVFAVHHRPFKGSKGFYRVGVRHAVSRVRSGERLAFDLIFHNAP